MDDGLGEMPDRPPNALRENARSGTPDSARSDLHAHPLDGTQDHTQDDTQDQTQSNGPDDIQDNALLRRELWTSWAAVLRSYAAVHSLGRSFHAVVEVSDGEILVRYGSRQLRFDAATMRVDDGPTLPFRLTVNGRAVVGETEDEMDLAAERLCREIITT